MEELKKVYKIGDTIPKEDIEKISIGIYKKAINVIATNGDRIALELQEGKHRELKQDLLQEIAIQLIQNNYTITKECYRIVRKYIYNKNRDIIELIIDTDTDTEKNDFIDIMNKKAYVNYINSYNEIEKSKNINIIEILDNNFTSRQIEIINIYAKTNSMQKTADLLGISKGTVNNTIRRLREKIDALRYEIA